MIKTLMQELLDTGWQSWSVGKNKSIFSLWRDFNPLKDEYKLPDSSFKNINLKKTITGWCSWYAFGRNISQKLILDQVRWFKDNNKLIPINYILIDEGWCRWGDWHTTIKNRFPSGMKQMSNEIHGHNFKSGIWIAPFLVEEDSDVYRNHSDWLVKRNGRYINGINWTFLDDLYLKRYILDIRKREVKEYIFQTVDLLIKNYGFDLIKLDFLYSIYFIPNITNGEASVFLRDLFKYIKNEYPKVYTIACGAPLVPLIGVTDSMRVGPDNASPMLDGLPIISSIYHYFRIRAVLRNIEKRIFTSKYWNVDPDAYVCRKSLGVGESKLLKLQKLFIKCVGNIFLGDDMTKLSKERIDKYILPLFKI